MSLSKILGIISITFFFTLISFIELVYAHCPLCVVATGSLVAASRWYGIDDLIVGTFLGGFVISTTAWFDRILKKRNRNKEHIRYQYPIFILASIALTLITFYSLGLLGTGIPNYILFGVDKLLIGFLIGSFLTLFAFSFNDLLRKNNGGKNHIPFQVIFLTVIFLLVTSFGYLLLELI